MNPARLLSLLSPQSVDPRRDQTGPSTAPARFQRSSDVPLAIAGLPDPYAAAARFRWARDMTVFPLLERHLVDYAAELANRDRWQLQFQRRDGYAKTVTVTLQDLARMCLLEEHHAAVLQTEVAKAALLNINEKSWRRSLAKGYNHLRVELEDWNSIAHRHIARRLS